MVILGIIFCLVLLSTLGVSFYLRKQAIAYVKLSTVYTNKFMSCEITLQEYANFKEEMKKGMSPLLKWYMRKEGILDGD